MLLHAIVRGRVQGVGFRYWVMAQAKALNLTGWVRNVRDGSVEVEAAGEQDELFELEQLLWKGPVLSRVEDVNCKYLDIERTFAGFTISH